jgi:hypothetical protein
MGIALQDGVGSFHSKVIGQEWRPRHGGGEDGAGGRMPDHDLGLCV